MEVLTINVIVGKEGRITIPSNIRKEHDIQEGDVIRITSSGQGQEIKMEVITK